MTIEQRLIKELGTTDDPVFAVWLLRDGTYVNGTIEGHQRDIDHHEISAFYRPSKRQQPGGWGLYVYKFNGEFRTNTVKGRNLADNIEYNRHMRPGRFYYVDGEYVCGGMLKKEFMPERISLHKKTIKELGLKPRDFDTAPYE